jgi:Ran GTPase-activating protein (RanGAP) involved in mRNA processing and transport
LSLDISDNELGAEEVILIADALGKNTVLLSLNISNNCLGVEGGRGVAAALGRNM